MSLEEGLLMTSLYMYEGEGGRVKLCTMVNDVARGGVAGGVRLSLCVQRESVW
jgi:hypothetical protein